MLPFIRGVSFRTIAVKMIRTELETAAAAVVKLQGELVTFPDPMESERALPHEEMRPSWMLTRADE
jgi:hypothetical protein